MLGESPIFRLQGNALLQALPAAGSALGEPSNGAASGAAAQQREEVVQLHLHVESLSARLEDAQGAAQRLQSALATEASNAKVGSCPFPCMVRANRRALIPLLHDLSAQARRGPAGAPAAVLREYTRLGLPGSLT